MHLIGLAGRARTGKSTIAEYLQQQHGFDALTFALPLKRALLDMLEPLGFCIEHLEDETLKERVFEPIGRSPRDLMQTLGTEWGRERVASDLWLRIARAHLERLRRTGVVAIVVTDVRFENEAALVRELGGIIWHVYRPASLMAPVRPHASEAGVQYIEGDERILNDGAIEDLYATIDRMAGRLEGV